MSYRALETEHENEKRRIIIGAPLVLVALFCFGLFMVHPADPALGGQSSSAASGPTGHQETQQGASSSSVVTVKPLLTLKIVNLPTLSPTTSADGSVGGPTASPQSAGGSMSAKRNSSGAPSYGSKKNGKIPVTSSGPNGNGLLQAINDLLH